MKKVKDYIKSSSQLERKRGIDKTIYKFRHVIRWYEKNRPRTEKSVALLNLLLSVADYLEVANDSFEKHISVLALAARNLYELMLRISSLTGRHNELENWMSEAITDSIQAIKCGLEDDGSTEKEAGLLVSAKNELGQEIKRLELLRKKHGLPEVKNSMPAGNLAGKVGMQWEHKSLFKLYSKLLHPSSMLVNNKDYCTELFFPIIEVYLQIHALQSYKMICDELELPEKVCKINHQNQ